jgi:hypothetical protein
MQLLQQKIMFEIYREHGDGDLYRVVYFTELGNRNREHEIHRAMEGEYFLDGFISSHHLYDAKPRIDGIVAQLNAGPALTPQDVAVLLAPFLVAE